jgi:ferredoxin
VRHGCICPIGSIQNVSLAVADPGYTVPFSVIAFFALPLLVALFFGRTFCAAVCPLGAMQEMVALRPVKVPAWLDHALGLIPFVYLGAAVVLAALGGAFIICEYDPFVSFFRLHDSASHLTANMLVLGACFLVVGLFVGRPYCRYLCPYGAVLGLCSRVSQRHVRIPPGECIKCRLCEDACPYGAILTPTVPQPPQQRPKARRRLAAMLALAPVLVAVGAVIGLGLAVPLARLHPTVRLAEYVRLSETPPGEDLPSEQELTELKRNSAALKTRLDAAEAFRNTGRSAQELYDEALGLRGRFRWGGALLGAWIGLVLGGKLVQLSLRRRREEFEPDKANCVSCGRCFWYCPHEQLRLGLIETLPASLAPPTEKTNGDSKSAPAGEPLPL